MNVILIGGPAHSKIPTTQPVIKQASINVAEELVEAIC
jgi:hypothetical protein